MARYLTRKLILNETYMDGNVGQKWILQEMFGTK